MLSTKVFALTFLSFFVYQPVFGHYDSPPLNKPLSEIKPEDQIKSAIYQLIEDFRISIIEHKDEEKFANLFLHDSITWAAIYVGDTKNKLLEQQPNFTFQPGDYKSFYNMLKDGFEERFYDIKIDIRDEFASVTFDYTFNVNSVIQNWGIEQWSLMLVNGQWKITSVTWSMNMEQIQKCPFASDAYFQLKK